MLGLSAQIDEAVRTIFAAKLRSFLAILGILVGTASVVALISSSQLATSHALAQFKHLGTHLLAVNMNPGRGGAAQHQQASASDNFHLSQMPQLVGAVPSIQSAAPYTLIYQNIQFHGKNLNAQILGATEALYQLVKVVVQQGRLVSALDVNSNFCMVGNELAESMRKRGFEPLGAQLRVGDAYFTVAGVLAPWPRSFFIFADINQSIIVPLQETYALSQYASIRNILFRLHPESDFSKVQEQIKSRLDFILPHWHVNFMSPKQIIEVVSKQRKTFTWLLGAIGGISLLVGGIGVMNIMLVSVVERRREIGIRMAIGARQRDILVLFLIEAIFLTLCGGVLGMLLGEAIAYGIAFFSKWEFHYYSMPLVLGFAVSVLVGILSGYYPAWRASRLDPVETFHET